MVKKNNYNTKVKRYLESIGYTCTVVEYYNTFTNRRKDFDGYLDAIGLNPDSDKYKILGVQLTSRSNISARYNKISKLELMDAETKELKPNPVPNKAKKWLLSGGGIWIVGMNNNSLKCKMGKIREIMLDGNDNFIYKDFNIGEKNNV